MVGKLFENTRLSSFVDLCEIASRYVLAKANMIGLIGKRRNNTGQITKAVTVAQLPEHHDEQLVPALVNSNRHRQFYALKLYI